MPSTCTVCKRTSGKHSNVSLHRFPPKSDPVKRNQWLTALGLSDDDVADHHRVCIRHFPYGDTSQSPALHLGKKFRSPKKMWTARACRAAKRTSSCSVPIPSAKRHINYSPSPVPSTCSEPSDDGDSAPGTRMSTPIGEVLLSDFSVHELPGECSSESAVDTSGLSGHMADTSTQVTVNTALVARIEALEAENRLLSSKLSSRQNFFRLECIAHSDSLIYFYTGFKSHKLLLAFFEFLGPAVNRLTYWGGKGKAVKKRKTKLEPLNQLFLTLIKLRLNLRERDIAVDLE